jgi:hypothetical protein
MPRQLELFPKTVYCIDTSSLINLKWPLQMREILPTIWGKLVTMAKNGELISPLEVYGEIKCYYMKDEIYHWCTKNKKIFKDIDECQNQKIREIQKYYDKKYWENEINKPKWADPWVMALSICEEAIIVADEKNTPNRIPFIASKFNLKYLELLDFFKEIGIKY